MKLTEDQLKNLFQDHSLNNQSTASASDCLAATDASSQRLKQVENLINDYTAAQAMKTAFASKDWSAQIAQSVKNQTVSHWFDWISHPFKTTATACALAVVVTLAIPSLNQQELQLVPYQPQTDIISSSQFESDVLKSGSFDGNSDTLFNGGFG